MITLPAPVETPVAITAPRRRVSALLPFAPLAVVFAVLGWRFSSSHWCTIWGDPNFSGWMAGIAARIGESPKLYADGAHYAMPPLPAVLIKVLSGDQVRWVTEARLDFGFKCLILTVLFAALLRWTGPVVTLVACLPATAAYFSLTKALLYDSMAQFLAATGAVAVTWFLFEKRGRRAALLLGAAAAATCLLTKQSTATGLLIGICAALMTCRTELTVRARAKTAAAFLAVTCVLAGLGLIALFPFVDPLGFVRDVLLHGSEPKGGTATLVENLARFSRDIFWPPGVTAKETLAARLLTVLAMAGALLLAGRRRAEITASWLVPGATAATFAGYPALLTIESLRAPALDSLTGLCEIVMNAFLPAALVYLAVHRLSRTPGPMDRLFALIVITLPTAMFHTLSVTVWAWIKENNPVMVIVLAVVASMLLPRTRPLTAVFTASALLVGLQLIAAPRFASLWNSADGTDRWQDVPFLRDADMPARADGLHRLVKAVRAHSPAPADRVLLLPEDPGVAAWFDRPRPALTSLIIFSDQYRDTYVEQDLARLTAHPPKVIVIGPRTAWRPFSHHWHPGTGAERLMDRVQSDLIPARYRLAYSQPIPYKNTTDHMDLYVLEHSGPPISR